MRQRPTELTAASACTSSHRVRPGATAMLNRPTPRSAIGVSISTASGPQRTPEWSSATGHTTAITIVAMPPGAAIYQPATAASYSHRRPAVAHRGPVPQVRWDAQRNVGADSVNCSASIGNIRAVRCWPTHMSSSDGHQTGGGTPGCRRSACPTAGWAFPRRHLGGACATRILLGSSPLSNASESCPGAP